MKKLILILASAALAAGCEKTQETTAGGGRGTIRIACRADAALDDTTAEANARTRAEIAAPDAADFALRITGADVDRSWQSLAAFEAEEPIFVQGDYTASVLWGDSLAEGPDKPCFAGSSDVEVQARRTATAHITARIVNAQALIEATEAFLRFYHDAEFTLETASGNTFTFRPGGTEAPEPVWVRAATTLTVKGSARGQSQDGQLEGPLYTFAPEPLAATRPATRHIFTFDAAHAGSATLRITLGEGYTETRTLDVELNEAAIRQ